MDIRLNQLIMDVFRLEAVRDELKITQLKIMCTGEIEVDWRNLRELQLLDDGRSLKRTDDDKITRLAESLLRFGIVNNLQVWFDASGNCYCFDAHHRRKSLEVLSDIGIDIPLLPATRCLAADEIDAKKMLLVKESTASWVDIEVVPDYIREVGISFEIAADTIDLPGFSWNEMNISDFNEDDFNDKSNQGADYHECPKCGFKWEKEK